MILDLDIGNTRVKWRVLAENGQPMRGGDWPRQEGWAAMGALGLSPARVRVASVAGGAEDRLIAAAVQQAFGLEAEFARTMARQDGLHNSYREPERMGVDRWLAMIAAWQDCQTALCVVDCGSALTIDLVGRDGVHRGGYIVPGLRMMAQVLLEDTGRVRFEPNGEAVASTPGTSTGEAVQHGTMLAVIGTIEAALARYGPDSVCYLTGGDAEPVQQQLTTAVVLRPELVLDGLAIAVP